MTVVRETPNLAAILAFDSPSAASLRINAQSSKVITLQSLSVHFSSADTVQFSSAADTNPESSVQREPDMIAVMKRGCPQRAGLPGHATRVLSVAPLSPKGSASWWRRASRGSHGNSSQSRSDIDEPGPGPDTGEVRHPAGVPYCRTEVAVHQVRRPAGVLVRGRGADPSATNGPFNPSCRINRSALHLDTSYPYRRSQAVFFRLTYMLYCVPSVARNASTITASKRSSSGGPALFHATASRSWRDHGECHGRKAGHRLRFGELTCCGLQREKSR